GTRGAGPRRGRARDVAAAGAGHALLARERVVARARRAGPLHPLGARVRVVAGTRGTRARTRGTRRIRVRRARGGGGARRRRGLGRGRRRGLLGGGRRRGCFGRRGARGRRGLRGRLRLRGRPLLDLLGRLVPVGFEGRLQAPRDGRRDAAGRALDELAHLFQLRERDARFDADLGGDFVNSWVGHTSPVRVHPGRADVKG